MPSPVISTVHGGVLNLDQHDHLSLLGAVAPAQPRQLEYSQVKLTEMRLFILFQIQAKDLESTHMCVVVRRHPAQKLLGR